MKAIGTIEDVGKNIAKFKGTANSTLKSFGEAVSDLIFGSVETTYLNEVFSGFVFAELAADVAGEVLGDQKQGDKFGQHSATAVQSMVFFFDAIKFSSN